MQVEVVGGVKVIIVFIMVEVWQIIEFGFVNEGLVNDVYLFCLLLYCRFG